MEKIDFRELALKITAADKNSPEEWVQLTIGRLQEAYRAGMLMTIEIIREELKKKCIGKPEVLEALADAIERVGQEA